MARRTRRPLFRALRLESRDLPSTTPYGPLVKPFTFTEVMASVKSPDPLGSLAAMSRSDAKVASLIDAAGSKVIFTDHGRSLVEVRLRSPADPLAAIDRLRAWPEVAWASPNYVRFDDGREWHPSDPLYGPPSPAVSQKSYLTKMEVDKAWDTQTGSSSVIIAVIDDGVAIEHPDLKPGVFRNKLEVGGKPGEDDDGNGFIDDINGWDFTSGDNDPNPGGNNTHGTFVAGIAAARTDNLDTSSLQVGVAGIAGGGNNQGDGARILPIRWIAGTGKTSLTTSVVAQSLAYAAGFAVDDPDPSKIRRVIANISYDLDFWANGPDPGPTGYDPFVASTPDPVVDAAFDYAYGKGVLIFNSAGDSDFGIANAPRGVFQHALHVASTDVEDGKTDTSNYGAYVDVAAPGVSMLSTLTSKGGTTFNYGSRSGTSMSAAAAAGAAALIWSEHPEYTRDQVTAQFLGTADPVAPSANLKLNIDYPNGLGSGRANPFRGITEKLSPPTLGDLIGLPPTDPVSGKPTTIPFLPETFGVHAPMRLNPATLVPSNFELKGSGPDGSFGTGDDVTIKLNLNGGRPYRMGTGQVVFTTGDIAPVGEYVLTIRSSPGGVEDPFGIALDGDRDKAPGGDFVHRFKIARQVSGTIFEDRDGDTTLDSDEPGLPGRTVYLDANNDGDFDGPIVYPAAFKPLDIPDGGSLDAKITISGFPVDLFTGFQKMRNVVVKVNISHPNPADLKVTLTSPGTPTMPAKTVTLVDAADGFDGQDFIDTVFDDRAKVNIQGAQAPFTGRFTPKEPFGGLTGKLIDPFLGLNPNGEWTLKVSDTSPDGGLFTGKLLGWSLGISIPDGEETAGLGSPLIVAGFADPLANVAVKLNVTHQRVDDLVVKLGWRPTASGPDLVTVILMDRNGLDGPNLINTILDDNAPVRIQAGKAPLTGTFRPVEPLSAFAKFPGFNANGTWTLTVLDPTSDGTDIGTLDDWSLILTPTSAEPATVTDAEGKYYFFDRPTGAVDVRRLAAVGWTVTATAPDPVAPTGFKSVTAKDKYNRSIPNEFKVNPDTDFGEWRRDAVYGRVYDDDFPYHDPFDPTRESPLIGSSAFYDEQVDDGLLNDDSFTVTGLPPPSPGNKIDGSQVHVFQQTVTLQEGRVTDLNVKLNIDHTAVGDLTAWLLSPDGREVKLVELVNGNGTKIGFTNTVLDDQATPQIFSGTEPFAGKFRPVEPLAAFNGLRPNGTWTLWVEDFNPSQGAGTLVDWSLEFLTSELNGASAENGTYRMTDLLAPKPIAPPTPAPKFMIARTLPPGYTPTWPEPPLAKGALSTAYDIGFYRKGDSFVGYDFGQTFGPAAPPPTVTKVEVNDGIAVQRSIVTSLKVTFSEAVTLPSGAAAAFLVERTGPGAPTGPLTVFAATAGNVVTLTFADSLQVTTDPGGSVADGLYNLTIVGAKVRGLAELLDGDNNGLQGGDFNFIFHRLFGDNDGDRDVDAVDYGQFRIAFGGVTNLNFDRDQDGDVDAVDFGQFRTRFGSSV